MRTKPIGKVIVAAKVENAGDLFNASQGLIAADRVRSVEISDALVDTGASTLSLPKRFISQLGLQPLRPRRARTAAGAAMLQAYGTVRLTVQGRDWAGDVVEIPDECPMLIGQLPLEGMDFVVDPVNQRLIGNPEHGGEQMIELYSFFV
jgi:clan AA aspartic protease